MAGLFGIELRATSPFSPPGRFAVVRVGEINLDFDDVPSFEPHHDAFLVDDEAFDRILGRVKALDLTDAADPVGRKTGQISHDAGGQGFSFRDPNGHNIELLTRAGEEGRWPKWRNAAASLDDERRRAPPERKDWCRR